MSWLACGGGESGDEDQPEVSFAAGFEVVDENGAPIAGATIDLGDRQAVTNGDGRAELGGLQGPVVALVGADGYITEPIPLDHSDTTGEVQVRLWSRGGGTRWVMHTGGDVMFGRRYVEPSSGDPMIPIDNIVGGARYVVDNIARSFSAADLRVLNLETVVSELPDADIYPGKRFILNSPPDTLAGLEALKTDVATLGNNHARDYMDIGVEETIRHLEDRGIGHVGGSADSQPADNPIYIEPVAGVRVAVLSWTTVNGDFVNDSYPDSTDPVPGECQVDPPERNDCFQWQERTWGYTGGTFTAPEIPRRI
ncbi:MAG: CapA family protein, partial [Myxococcota bacterium]